MDGPGLEQQNVKESDLQTVLKLVNWKPTKKKTNKQKKTIKHLSFYIFPLEKKGVKNKIYNRAAHKNTQQHVEMPFFSL